MNKNNYLKSYPGKEIAVGNNCLDKTPFVPRSCSLMEWRAFVLVTDAFWLEFWGVSSCVQRGWGIDLTCSQQASEGIPKSPGGQALSDHLSISGAQPLDNANPLVLMLPYKVWLRIAVLRYLVRCPRSLSKMVVEQALEFFLWWWHVVFWTSDAITSPSFGVCYLVCLPVHKPCQEWLTLCVLPVTLKLLSPSSLDRY